jgi:serine/threonine-protein kinase
MAQDRGSSSGKPDDGTDDTMLRDPAEVATAAPTGAALAATAAPARPSQATTAGLRGPALRARRPSRDPIAAAADQRYELGELLGQGGMGEVVLAYDEQIGREVAIKRIRGEQPSSGERARFWREARVQGRLEHPAVVPVHDIAIDRDGKPFFVMKRLSGTTMQDLMRKLRDGTAGDQDIERRRLMRAFVDVCLAVEFAHSRGIIHRDLKPANVMLGDFGEVYVLDWGIARAVHEADESGATPRPSLIDIKLDTGDTAAGTVMGTPGYAAPEQLVGDKAGPAADIYALGCMLFEIVAGEPMHKKSRDVGNLGVGAEPRPSKRRSDAPPELDAVCVAATVLEPHKRYASARALGDAVQAFLDGDRDVAVRKELAVAHLREARAALARGTSEADRRAAMREAGRALALDPTATDAAELVTHLMLTPPDAAPAEVEAAIAVHDVATARAQGKLAARSLYAYLAFVPLFVWTGVRDWRMVIALLAAALACSAQVWLQVLGARIRPGAIYANAGINALILAIVVRIAGPFLIAPPLALAMMIGYAAHPRFGRTAVIGAILAAGIAVPWVLELAGVLSPTYTFENGNLVLSSRVLVLSAAPIQIACALVLVALLAVVGILSRYTATRQRAATQQLELQAWHLRQILPATRPPSTPAG